MLSLDLLRLLALVLVLGHHLEPPPNFLPGPFQSALDLWYRYGGIGVDLFFVLSGFLVSGLLFSEYRKHGTLSVSRFYVRRAWKIYPSFYFLIGCTYFFCLLVLGYKLRDRPIYTELLFLQCYQQGHWNHTWSLAVEEHFYLALPIVLWLLVRRNRGAADPFRAVLYLVAATSLFCLAARIINFQLRSEVTYHTHAFPTHLRIDSLFFGVAIAYAYHFHQASFRELLLRWRYALIATGVALVALLIARNKPADFYSYTFGFTQLYLAAAAVLVGVLMCQVPANRVTIFLAAIGSYSYSIYLWHMALKYYAFPHLRAAGISWQIRSAIYLLGAFVVGIAMAKLIELPVLRIRDRWFPSRSAAATMTAPLAPASSEPVRHAA